MMKIDKYSPNWLLNKINKSNSEAKKLLYIIEFQNSIIEEYAVVKNSSLATVSNTEGKCLHNFKRVKADKCYPFKPFRCTICGEEP